MKGFSMSVYFLSLPCVPVAELLGESERCIVIVVVVVGLDCSHRVHSVRG